jgi:hypothetical protein
MLMFNTTSVHGGIITVPQRDDRRVPLTIMPPVEDVHVRISRREGFENVHLILTL